LYSCSGHPWKAVGGREGLLWTEQKKTFPHSPCTSQGWGADGRGVVNERMKLSLGRSAVGGGGKVWF